ncbi:hypothetical protein L1049_017077 [Liquidambar formosana]|uniref:Glycosyltransferase n=1 Tax=Liquidambar formosana TaxID=63359 RepID=A0AAP0S703_LIQFO
MESVSLHKPHAVLVPYPAQGHVNPIMQFAKLLHARGFHVTFVNTEYNHKRLVHSKGPDSVKGLPDFRFTTIPDGLPPSDYHHVTQDIATLCDSTRNNSLIPFRELLAKLNSSPDVPPVTCIISDAVMSFTMQAAKELGIPEAQFWTASACGLMGYFQFSELAERGLVPFKDKRYMCNGCLDTPLDWIPGMRGIQLMDMPTFARITDRDDIMFNFMIEQMQNCSNSMGIIINTFDDLESEVLNGLVASSLPRIYTIGPLTSLLRSSKMPAESQLNSVESSFWKEDTECLDWLDKRDPADSVVYVNFGSLAVMTEEQMREFAWGLAGCGYPFVWILRPDVVMGNSAVLPEGFLEETRERGLIASWCPQEKVLSHPSVGVFLTHAGWNSLLESIRAGVPVMCWPVIGEQPMNCRYVCDVWGIGMRIANDVKRNEVVGLVKEMMVGRKGKEIRQNVMAWKKKAEAAASSIGGSSFDNFDRLINEVLLQKQ